MPATAGKRDDKGKWTWEESRGGSKSTKRAFRPILPSPLSLSAFVRPPRVSHPFLLRRPPADRRENRPACIARRKSVVTSYTLDTIATVIEHHRPLTVETLK